MSYYVHGNWTVDKAVSHTGACTFSKTVAAFTFKAMGNSRWHGPFHNRE